MSSVAPAKTAAHTKVVKLLKKFCIKGLLSSLIDEYEDGIKEWSDNVRGIEGKEGSFSTYRWLEKFFIAFCDAPTMATPIACNKTTMAQMSDTDGMNVAKSFGVFMRQDVKAKPIDMVTKWKEKYPVVVEMSKEIEWLDDVLVILINGMNGEAKKTIVVKIFWFSLLFALIGVFFGMVSC